MTHLDADIQIKTEEKRKLDIIYDELLCPKITPEVEDVFSILNMQILLESCDNFIEELVSRSCKLAKIRGKGTPISLHDVQLELDLNWSIRVPGHASNYFPAYSTSSLHESKVSQIAKKRRNDMNKVLYKMQDNERNANELSLAFEKGQVDGDSDDLGFD